MNNVLLSSIDTQTLVNLIAERTVELLESRKSETTQQEEEEELKTPKEASKLLRVSMATLWRWEKKGKIKCYGIGGKRYYKRSELVESLTLKN